MSGLAAGTGVDSIAGYGTDWLYVLVPLAVYALAVAAGVRRGSGRGFLARWSDGAEQMTGLPGYAATGVLTGATGLLIAALGFYWDVAWHVDLGRDELLWTPGHTAIIVGLGFIPVTAAVTVAVATATRADVALRWRGWRAPIAAVPLAVLGLGAMTGFPLDEFWHRAYGVDVTMWGPTHITMIGGASFAPIALLLLLREAGPGRHPGHTRFLIGLLCGGALLGLSTFQLEYDLGVSQWQALFHPVLVTAAGGFALVLAREILGPGGALVAALHFTAHRVAVYFLLRDVLHHTSPRWALYLGSALVVEAAYLLARRRGVVATALVAGAGVGTIGLATEWAWSRAWARWPWNATLLPEVGIAVAAGLAAALLGVTAGRVAAGRRAGVPAGVLGLAVAALLVTIALPFPRHPAGATITMRTTPAGPGRVHLVVSVDPPAAVENANRFSAFSWQGGHSEQQALVPAGDGTWRAPEPVPVGGTWKTLVRLLKGQVLAGAPVFMPRDDEIGAPEIPAVPERTVPFDRDTVLLMREARAGAALPAVLAYTAVGLIAVAWFGSLVFAFRRSARHRAPAALDGKRVVVTGALGGIGTAVCAALREQGAHVAGLDLVADDAVIAVDVTDADSCREAVTAAARRLGGIDVLVHLAGIGRAQDAGDFPDREARRTLDVNLFGTWNTTAAAVPWLTESHGHVVVTASGLAIASVPYAAAYAASKRAVSAYADTLRLEYAGRLTVTTVNPGYVRTSIHEVAAAAGASLEGVVPPDGMAGVVDSYLRACVQRPRAVATSARTTLALGLARRFPAPAERVVLRALRRLGRPDPAFVLGEAELAARRAAVAERARP